MANDDQIRNKKLQQYVNREAEKISVLSSRKSNKYEFLTSEEIVTPDQRRVIEQTTFAYYPLGKAFWKKKKSVDEQEEKQVEAVDVLDPEKHLKLKSVENLLQTKREMIRLRMK